MYAFEDMLSLCNQKWRSPAHKKVAAALLIGNAGVHTRDQLIDLGGAINKLSVKEVKELTIEGAVKLGVPFNTGGIS